MTRLLISVRSAAEAEAAMTGGADIIDVKEPLRGALGAADVDVLRAVRDAVDTALPLSAALGELRHEGGGEENGAAPRLPYGYRYAKLGLAGCDDWPSWRQRWRSAMLALPQAVEAVAVAYADWRLAAAPTPGDVLDAAVQFGCVGLLVDTFDKQAGDLFHWLAEEELAALIEAAQRERMFVALGGSLTLESAPRAIATRADVIAVRGAACSGDRSGRIDLARVRSLAAVVKRHPQNQNEFPQAGRQNA
jgi:uncharacterized protein (UPF0264 family)